MTEVIAATIFGALWRRLHGMGLPPYRWVRLALAGAATAALTWHLGPAFCGIITAIMVINFMVGYTDFETLMVMWIRYTPAPFIISLLLWLEYGEIGMLLYAFVGPAVALAYWLAARYPIKSRGAFIDGSNALAELWLGAVMFGGLAAIV